MTRTRAAMERLFSGADRVLEAIENGEDPQPLLRRMHDAAPFHILAIGQAAILDDLDREDEADGISTAP